MVRDYKILLCKPFGMSVRHIKGMVAIYTHVVEKIKTPVGTPASKFGRGKRKFERAKKRQKTFKIQTECKNFPFLC